MKILLFLILTLSGISFNLSAGDPPLNSLFQQGNEAYEKGNYLQALTHYEQALKKGGKSGKLHYNLGSAYFRLGRIGEAIFHFRKAKDYLPRNPDVSFNLQYARKKAIDRIKTEKKGWLDIFIEQIPLNQKEVYYFFLFSSVLFWGICISLLFKKNEALRWMRLFFALPFLASFIVWGLQLANNGDFGVIKINQTGVYSAIGKDNVVLFYLHSGTEFGVEEKSEDKWIKIVLQDGKKGWIREDAVIVN